MKCLNRFSEIVVGGFERFFYRYGKLVASNPWKVILICLVSTCLCGIGLIEFYSEVDPYKLWVPRGSDSVENDKWLKENFPPDTRFNSILFTGEDILQPDIIKEMFNIHQEVASLEIAGSGGLKWANICKKLPIVTFDPANPPTNCDMISDLTATECFETSILEIWGYDFNYDSLTSKDDILTAVNQETVMSQVFNVPMTLENYMNITRDSDGQIVKATATLINWFEQVNSTEFTAAGLPANEVNLEFEAALKDVYDKFKSSFANDFNVDLFLNIARGFDDLAGDFIVDDIILMPVGFLLVFIYVMIMLGKFNCVETRAFLALSGLFSIIMTMVVSFGLCSAFQLFYGPTHSVIPFIMLGIGIDDMFVIMQCFDNLRGDELTNDNEEKIAIAMKHAGVAITVTSLTDFIVFIVGASSSLPALSSFCLYCAISIIAVYIFQATFFVACLSLDLKRIDANRNGCCFCYTHKNHEHSDQKLQLEEAISQKIFRKFGEILVKPVSMVIVLLCTFTLLGVASWGVSRLEVLFESIWFLPPDSYLTEWFYTQEEYFPSDGVSVTVYMTDLDYPNELDKIQSLTYSLSNSSVVRSVDSWYPDYKSFVDLFGFNIPTDIMSQSEFDNVTSWFLYSPSGSKWQPNFYLEETLICGQPISKILMTTFSFVHTRFEGTSEHIAGMNEVKEIIDGQDFSANVFPMTPEYANWETDEVIRKELFRNLGVSMACIFVTTLILLANIQASLMVMLCVVMSLINVLGYMQFWGLTIDTVSSINVIIAIGLCVDYSAHIAHTFLTIKGSRKSRVIDTLRDIGPAVLNGGTSTFIALIVLAPSDSHVFLSFFRIFFLVIIFGLFHGLVFLPLMLRLIGPASYQHYDKNKYNDWANESTAEQKIEREE